MSGSIQVGNGGDARVVETGTSARRNFTVGGQRFHLTIEGLDRLDHLLVTAAAESTRIVGRAVNEEVQLIAAASIPRTPKHYGYLRGSQQITGPIEGGHDYVESTIRFGNTAAWYAWLVHEREYTASGKKINYKVGGAKYLSKTVDAAIPVLGDRIGARVQAILDGLI